MRINEIFLKDVTRSIEGVVKADDAQHLRVEVEEYVLTNDAAKGVAPLLEEYTNYTNANGVWISGFFGSGKSHLLKMLAHLLGEVEGQDFPRDEVAALFHSKTEDAMLQASLRKAAAIPAKSLLFNIDQKATLISKDQTDALLKVFVKVFDESRGYYGNDGAVARFERDLDRRGQYEAFKEAFERHAGIDWSQGREQTALEGHNIDAAYRDINDGQANSGIMEQYQSSYAVSIEDFADSVKEWIDEQTPGYRLNFFIDEVGQFIADDIKLMLNLQTIVESLNTKCRGRAWVFVTSQEDMEKVIGDRSRQQSNDFSKIQARFGVKVKLTSQDVEEVIAKRLLEKNAGGTDALAEIYRAESANFPTIFNFVDGAKNYRNYVDQSRFVATYPFVTYQIPMFQAAIEGLSDHNMFEGRNSSVGERSMLGVVQQVAKRIGAERIGYLATFDQMFAGISASLKSAAQSAILQAEKHLPEPNSELTILANRLLKALFLVKYVDSFKATPRNLAVLVYDRFGLDLTGLGSQVQEALNLLEAQSYVQRNGNLYEYLTNEEQEIEKEIKAVEIDSSEVSAKLFRYLNSEILRTSKIRYDKNGQDFSFGYKLDDVVQGKQHDLTIHFVTPETAYEDQEIFTQSIGADELRVFLGRDKRVLADLRLLLKTEKYIRQRTNSGTTPSVHAILQSKQALVAERDKDLIERLRQLVGCAQLIVNAMEVHSSAQDPVMRVREGFQELISRTYTNLALLDGRVYSEQRVADMIRNEPGLVAESEQSALRSPAAEMEAWIVMQTGRGEQVTMKKIVDRFETKPYGWDLGSIEVVLAWLLGTGKIVLTVDANPVMRTEATAIIRNTAKHAHVLVAPQKAYDQVRVGKFRRFCTDFFDDGSVPSDTTELAHYGKDRLAAKRTELKGIMASSRYPFVSRLSEVVALLDEVVQHPADWFLTEFDSADELIGAKEDLIDPIRTFLNGQQAKIFDEAQSFLTANAANLAFLPAGAADRVKGLLEDPNAFLGAKMNVLKVALDDLSGQVDDHVREAREEVVAAIADRREELLASAYYERADESARRSVVTEIDCVIESVSRQSDISMIHQTQSAFERDRYTAMIERLDASTHDDGQELAPVKSVVSIATISVKSGSGILDTAADVDAYLAALRRALISTLDDGKRIVL